MEVLIRARRLGASAIPELRPRSHMPRRTHRNGGLRLVEHACPRCGSAEIRKLSLIYQTGLPANAERKPAHEAALSKQAAPPTKKPAVMWVVAAFMFVIVAVAMLWSSRAMTAMAFLFLAIAIGFAVRAMTYNSMVFPRLHDQWERSFMCNRCGNIFVE
jgi:hypothetical protein